MNFENKIYLLHSTYVCPAHPQANLSQTEEEGRGARTGQKEEAKPVGEKKQRTLPFDSPPLSGSFLPEPELSRHKISLAD